MFEKKVIKKLREIQKISQKLESNENKVNELKKLLVPLMIEIDEIVKNMNNTKNNIEEIKESLEKPFHETITESLNSGVLGTNYNINLQLTFLIKSLENIKNKL